jgi:hypothetical protein
VRHIAQTPALSIAIFLGADQVDNLICLGKDGVPSHCAILSHQYSYFRAKTKNTVIAIFDHPGTQLTINVQYPECRLLPAISAASALA